MKNEHRVIWEDHNRYFAPLSGGLTDAQECIYKLNDEFVIKKDILTRPSTNGQYVCSKEYIISLCRIADLVIKEKKAEFLKMPVDIIMPDDGDGADEAFKELSHRIDV